MFKILQEKRREEKRIIIIACALVMICLCAYMIFAHPGIKNRIIMLGHGAREDIYDYAVFYHGRDYISTGDAVINCLGDSLTEGYKNDEISWADRLSVLTMANKVNKYGIGGSTVSTYVDKNPMCVRYREMADDADYIVIFAGNNDFTQSVPMGDEDSLDTDNFYGALNVMLAGLREKYPAGKFLYVTPLRMWNYRHPKWQENVEYTSLNEQGYTLDDYRRAIINRCEYYSIPYLDLYSHGLYGRTEATRDAVYVDGLHPNDAGHRMIASQIADALKRQ